MNNKKLLWCAALSLMAATAHGQCTLLTAADAEMVLGPNVTDLTASEDAEFQCMFLGGEPQGTLTVQFNPREYFDQATILEPHTPADVGEQGRTNVDTNGVTALQFLQGASSVTMSVRAAGVSDRSYLDALIAVGQRLAERLE